MKRMISLLAAAGLLLAAPLAFADDHPCDFDGNGAFDQADKDAILAVQGEVVVPGSDFDLDGDGVVSLRDVSICIQNTQ
jgi:hypothetical protein